MIWLNVGSTNRNPSVILGFYIDTILHLKGTYCCNNLILFVVIHDQLGCPQVIRIDKGVENSKLAEVQIALRMFHRDCHAQERSVTYGPSPANSVKTFSYNNSITMSLLYAEN